MRRVPPRHWLRLAKQPSHLRILPPVESISESPDVMEVHSDWRTPFMKYLRTGGCLTKKTSMNDCVLGQDITL
jgi:hypothetical protein